MTPTWEAFLDLHRARGSGPISWLEVDAYSRARGIRFSAVELDALRALDTTWLRFVAAKLKAERAPNG